MNPPGGRQTRSDSQRNRGAIIDAAVTALCTRPGASVAEIAAAAGVSRATVYGHFPSRPALVAAAFHRVIHRVETRFRAIDPGVPIAESIDGLIADSWLELSSFARLAAAVEGHSPRAERHRPYSRIGALLSRGRDQGVYRDDQSLEWQTECFYAIVQAGASRIRDDRLPPSTVATEMITTIRAILGATPGGSAAGSAAPRAR